VHPVGSHCTDTKRQLFSRIFTSTAEQQTLRMTEAFVDLILTFVYAKSGGMSSVTYCVCTGSHVRFIIVGKTVENLEKKRRRKIYCDATTSNMNFKNEFIKYRKKYNNILKVYVKREMAVKRKIKDKNRTQQYPEKQDVGKKMKMTGQSTAK
jgi:hypothetical protein